MIWTVSMLLFAFVFAFVLLVVAWSTKRLIHRQGMSQSVTGRAGQMGALVTRRLLRQWQLRLYQLFASRERRAQLQHQYHIKTADEAARTMGQMKGVFMKIGQIISFTNESLPPQARASLAQLQAAAPPMEFALVRQVVEAELGDRIEHLFRRIDDEPIAAASIGQVHRATLEDGSEVVLKVQYPGVDRAIEADLKASSGLAALIGAVNRNIDADAVVDELKTMIRQELDYCRELRNQQLFHRLWADHPLIHVPRVYPEYSSRRVLCQEFRRGLTFGEFVAHANENERKLSVRVLHDFVFDSINKYCVFNGDPHPGNYLFHDDGGITFLDYGCVKYFDPDFIRKLHQMNRALVENDRAAFAAMCLELALVLPGRSYDLDYLWEFMTYNAAPMLRDQPFTFTSQWIRRAGEFMSSSQMRQVNLPRDFLFLNRITFGLNSMFLQLCASENFHRFNRRYIYADEPGGAPALALAGIELPAKYLTSALEPSTPMAVAD
jgi:predicted unusual protein kinase regulating ubiquinone biosynthesis (AarF/ABC1/UbiB family)